MNEEQYLPVPGDYADWDEIEEFAYSFDGYGAFARDAVELGTIANEMQEVWRESGQLPDDVHLLCSALFFEQRRFRHYGRAPTGPELDYPRALVARIREIASGPLPVTTRP